MLGKLRSLFYLLGSLLLIGVLLFYLTFYWDNTQFLDKKEIFIPSNADFEVLMEVVGPHIKSPRMFAWAARLKGYQSRVRSGRYLLEPGASNQELINRLRQQSDPIRITFNNQERIENLAGRLAATLEADSLSFLKAMRNPTFLQEKGFNQTNALAMYIPNSYDVFWDINPAAFRDRMHREYQQFWSSDRRNQAAVLGLTPLQVMGLASIVHKETVRPDERPTVAGVYLNRLKRRMKLQADPTVIFALKQTYQNFDTVIKRVLYKDLRIPSPFNTYRIKGIPPGPIAMPDVSAIDAVLWPENHSYLYFVANPNRPGYHLFASTLSQHNRNKRRYTTWLNRQKLYR